MLKRFCWFYLGVSAMTMSAAEPDPYIVELYQAYCVGCHAQQSDAPIAFDPKQWQGRLAKGQDRVLENAINGIGNMPPLGMCQECGEQDLMDLIEYMSQAHQP